MHSGFLRRGLRCFLALVLFKYFSNGICISNRGVPGGEEEGRGFEVSLSLSSAKFDKSPHDWNSQWFSPLRPERTQNKQALSNRLFCGTLRGAPASYIIPVCVWGRGGGVSHINRDGQYCTSRSHRVGR